jgi:hypothetical protein
VGLERTEVLGVIASALHVAFTNGQILESEIEEIND